MQAQRDTLPTYFGPGFWVTWRLGPARVVAYVYGIEDHDPEHQEEEAALAKQGILWTSVWSELTNDTPDHGHESPRERGAVYITPAEALSHLDAIGVSRDSLRAQEQPIPLSLGLV